MACGRGRDPDRTPSRSDPLTLCTTIEDFATEGGSGIETLVVAGVGSSALGSAAFARNVADAIERPVAAVISGYGLVDVLTEALGGFFWFGALNSIRHSFEELDRATEMAALPETNSIESAGDLLLMESRDTGTIVALLQDPRFRFDLLIGHSKGNLVLSEALYDLSHLMPERVAKLARSACIVTMSACIAMPLPFRRVIDVIGAWDWFGGLNSRPDILPDYVVPNAWHHTNTELPAHLPVTNTLRAVLGLS